MFQCPHCNNTDDFIITHPVEMRLTQTIDGAEGSYHVRIPKRMHTHEYVTPEAFPWDDNDTCHCEACGHDDPIWAFVV